VISTRFLLDTSTSRNRPKCCCISDLHFSTRYKNGGLIRGLFIYCELIFEGERLASSQIGPKGKVDVFCRGGFQTRPTGADAPYTEERRHGSCDCGAKWGSWEGIGGVRNRRTTPMLRKEKWDPATGRMRRGVVAADRKHGRQAGAALPGKGRRDVRPRRTKGRRYTNEAARTLGQPGLVDDPVWLLPGRLRVSESRPRRMRPGRRYAG